MRFAATTALMLLLAAPAAGQSADALLGAWQLERDTPRGAVQVPFTFAAEGDSIVVYVGADEARTSLGKVAFDGTTVSFPMDLRAMMQQAMARQGGGQRAGAAGRGGQRAGGPPQRGGEGAGGRGAGGQAGATPPNFSGTLEGTTITGAVESPRGAQQFVLRRVQSG